MKHISDLNQEINVITSDPVDFSYWIPAGIHEKDEKERLSKSYEIPTKINVII